VSLSELNTLIDAAMATADRIHAICDKIEAREGDV